MKVLISFLLFFSSLSFASSEHRNDKLTKQDVTKIISLYRKVIEKTEKCNSGCQQVLDPDKIIVIGDQESDLGALRRGENKILIIRKQADENSVILKFHYSYRGSCEKPLWGRNPYSHSFGYMGCLRYRTVKEEKTVKVILPKDQMPNMDGVLLKISYAKDDYRVKAYDLDGNELVADKSSGFLGLGRGKVTISKP